MYTWWIFAAFGWVLLMAQNFFGNSVTACLVGLWPKERTESTLDFNFYWIRFLNWKSFFFFFFQPNRFRKSSGDIYIYIIKLADGTRCWTFRSHLCENVNWWETLPQNKSCCDKKSNSKFCQFAKIFLQTRPLTPPAPC